MMGRAPETPDQDGTTGRSQPQGRDNRGLQFENGDLLSSDGNLLGQLPLDSII